MQKQCDDNFSQKNLFYIKSLKTLKNCFSQFVFNCTFLTNEITSVHDSGACFIEYVFEFFLQ